MQPSLVQFVLNIFVVLKSVVLYSSICKDSFLCDFLGKLNAHTNYQQLWQQTILWIPLDWGNFKFNFSFTRITNDIYGGTHGVMVIIVENENSNPSSKPEQGCLHFPEH